MKKTHNISGNGAIDEYQADQWVSVMDEYEISQTTSIIMPAIPARKHVARTIFSYSTL